MASSEHIYAAPSAVIEGDVSLGAECSIWHGAVIRGDEAPISVGPRTNVQDNAVIHVGPGHGVCVGAGVTIGHSAIVHGCTVGENTLIGMGAIVLNGAHVGSDCIIGAGALVTQDTVIPNGSVAVGSPAKVVRCTKPEEVTSNRQNAIDYVQLGRQSLLSVGHTAINEESAMQIRRAQEGDIPGLSKLLLQVCQVHADGRPDLFQSGGTKYTAEELAVLVKDDERPIFVAVDESETVLGYAFCVYEDYTQDSARTHIKTLYIDDICVDEEARGQHVGSALYDFVIGFAREQGFYNVTLNVWTCNPGAQRFYEAMGMKPYKVAMEQIL